MQRKLTDQELRLCVPFSRLHISLLQISVGALSTFVLRRFSGDSRAVVASDGKSSFGTEDHKPYLDKERERIVGAGGSVWCSPFYGNLKISR